MKNAFAILKTFAGRWSREGGLVQIWRSSSKPLRQLLLLILLLLCVSAFVAALTCFPASFVWLSLSFASGTGFGTILGWWWLKKNFCQLVQRLADLEQELSSSRELQSRTTQELATVTDRLGACQLRLQTLLETIPDIVVETDRQFVFTSANSAAFRFYGHDLIGREAKEFFYYPQPVYSHAEPLLNGEVQALYLEDWLRRQDGACRLIAWHARPMRDQDGKIVGILGVGRDITDLRKVEAENRSKAELFTAVASAAQDAVIIIDQLGQITFWNNSAARIFGYSPEEVLGKDVHRLLCPPELLPHYEKNFITFARTGTGPVVGQTLRLEAIRKDRTRVPIELSVGAFRQNGNWCAVAVVRDITRQVALEQQLRASETKYRLLAESVDDIIWSTDTDWRITYVNGAAEVHLGIPPASLEKEHLSRLLTPEAVETVKDLLRSTGELGADGASTSFTALLEHQTIWQTPRRGEVRLKALRGPTGEWLGLVGVSRLSQSASQNTLPIGDPGPIAEFLDSLFALAKTSSRVEPLLTKTAEFLKSARLIDPSGSVELCQAASAADTLQFNPEKLLDPLLSQDFILSDAGACKQDSSTAQVEVGHFCRACHRPFKHVGGQSSADQHSEVAEITAGDVNRSTPCQQDRFSSENVGEDLLIPLCGSTGQVFGIICCRRVIMPTAVQRIIGHWVAPIVSLLLAREYIAQQVVLLSKALRRKSRFLHAFVDLGCLCSEVKWDEIVDENELLQRITNIFSRCVEEGGISGVRVVLFGKEASTPRFCDSIFKLAAPIYWNGQLVGAVEISLPPSRTLDISTQEWNEERLYLTHLVTLLSQILGHHLSRFALASSGYWAALAYSCEEGQQVESP